MALKKISAVLGERLRAMEPKKRMHVVRGSIVGVLLAVFLGMYYMSGRSNVAPVKAETPISTISVGESRLEDDIRASVEKASEDNRNQIKAQNETIDSLKKQSEADAAKLKAMEAVVRAFAEGKGTPEGLDLPEGQPASSANLPPPPPSNPDMWAASTGPSGQPVTPLVEYLG